MIPELITQYDKVIFSDVDIIFTADLSAIYNEVDLTVNYMAGVKSALVKQKYIKSIGCEFGRYINGGFQIYNTKAIRDDNMTPKLKELCGKKFFYLDQDITNIIYKDRITYISPSYNSTQTFFNLAHDPEKKLCKIFSDEEIKQGLKPYVIHYNGLNPWQGLCERHDLWWQHYRESIYFDEIFYFSHYKKILTPSPKTLLKQLPKATLKKPFGKIYRRLFPY